MKKRKIILALLLLTCFFGLGALYWFLNPPAMMVDPAFPRPALDYDRTVAELKAEPVTNNVFSLLQLSTNDGRVEIMLAENPAAGPKQEVFPSQVVPASANHHATLDEGQIFLKYIATAWSIPATNFQYGVDVPARFFDSNLVAIAPEDLRPKLNQWDRRFQFRGDFPKVRFLFGTTNLPSFKLLGMDLFDARTHRSLSSGYSSHTTPDGFSLEPTVRLWHKAPIEAFVHLAHGHPQLFHIDPLDHDEKQIGPARIKLAAVLSGLDSGISSSSDGHTNRIWLHFASGSAERQTAVVLFVWPNAYRAPIDCEILDADGNKLETAGSSTSGPMHVINVRADGNRIKNIRLKFYPLVSRVRFSIPFVPALPPENAAITNLLDVRIPCLRIEAEYEFRASLESLLQLTIPFQTMNFPQSYFPVTFTNRTTRELLDEYLQFAPPKQHPFVNVPEGQLQFRDPPLLEIWEKIKGIFQK